MSNILTLTIDGRTRSVFWWAKAYDLPYRVLRYRVEIGMTDDDLLAPLRDDVLDKEFIHKLWGGKWVYTGKKTPKRYKGNRRWVYVPKVKEQIN